MSEYSYLVLQSLNEVYKNTKQKMAFKAKNKKEWQAWRKKLKAKIIELLGGFPAKKCALNPQIVSRTEDNTVIREKIVLTSESGVNIPAYLLIPKNLKGPVPAVIALHGHLPEAKEMISGMPALNKERRKYMVDTHHDYGYQIARRGFVVLVPDQRCFGEREDKDMANSGGFCHRSAMSALLLGKTMIGMRVWDVIREIDYLQTRKEVIPDRIGVAGLSGGGTTTLFSAALDERLKAAVVSGYFCTFKDSIFNIFHCTCNFVPHILEYAEMYDIASLIAPRAVLVETGSTDPIFPQPAVKAAFEKLKKVYKLLKIEDKADIDAFEGDHMWSGAKAYDFLKKQL